MDRRPPPLFSIRPTRRPTAEGILESIDKARHLGYALLEQQLAMSVRGIAVAIRNREGKVLGAISVSLHMGKETSDHAVARSLPLLREAEYALLSTL